MFRVIAFLLAAGTAAADTCDDLWFTRNQIMDRAGYCFGSVLGQAVFDNAGCTGSSVSLSPPDTALVQTIRDMESRLGCQVNTRSTHLDLRDIAARWRLRDLPVADEFESACIGYLRAPVALLAGTSDRTEVVHWVEPGNHIGFGHIPRDGWTYVIATDENSNILGGGWMPVGLLAEQDCRQWAG